MTTPRPQIKACLFDMDGLLINTEDMYTLATNEVLARHGRGPLPWEVKLNLQGRPGVHAAQYFLDWSKLPLTPEELFAETSERQERLWPTAQFMPGARELLEYLYEHGVPTALGTSSMRDKYGKKTAHLRAGFDLFGEHVVTGDDSRIPPGRGKPAPDIWHVALGSLNAARAEAGQPAITPAETLVFEDGIPGVESARAAGCHVVWVPHPEALKILSAERVAEVIGPNEMLRSLEEFDPKKYGL